MATMQNVVDLARVDMNDPGKVRWSDAKLLAYGNDALQLAKVLRSDLFIGSLGTPLADLALGNTFPLPLAYRRLVADFIIGRAALKDDENAQGARAPAYLTTFNRAMGT